MQQSTVKITATERIGSLLVVTVREQELEEMKRRRRREGESDGRRGLRVGAKFDLVVLFATRAALVLGLETRDGLVGDLLCGW